MNRRQGLVSLICIIFLFGCRPADKKVDNTNKQQATKKDDRGPSYRGHLPPPHALPKSIRKPLYGW